MELIERIPLVKTEYVLSLEFADLEPHFNKCKTQKERKDEFKKIRDFCITNRRTQGEMKRLYTKPKGCKVDNRLYSGGSVQSLPKEFRSFFMGDSTTDIDMVNCHPVILSYICKKESISCPKLYEYVKNRDKILASFSDRNEGKTAFLCSVNCDKLNGKILNKFFKEFDKEMKEIHEQLLDLENYAEIIKSVPEGKEFNKNGSAINRILCGYENQILQEVVRVVRSLEIEPAVLMFDGLMVYGNEHDNESLLKTIEQAVEKKFPTLGMKWSVKDQDCEIEMPADFSISKEIVPFTPSIDLFEIMSTEFEKTHCKIVNKSVYINTVKGVHRIMTPDKLRSAYAHMSCGKDNFGNPICFIDKWIHCNDKIRRYDDMEIFPNMALCPSNIFNLWTPFTYDLLEGEYEKDPEGLEFFLNHFKILSNHEEAVYEYFVKWTARMIQYPELKSTAPMFIGKEGGGKGSYFDTLRVLMGSDKIMQTQKPDQHVWGNFNGGLANAFLVNIDEISKKQTLESEGIIKGLITEPTIRINEKGKESYEIKSYHKFIFTSNDPNPIETKKGDRRKVIINASNEKIGDVEYFEKFHNYISCENTMRTLWDYLKELPDVLKIERPLTTYQKNMQEASRSKEDLFLEDFVITNEEQEEIKIGNDELYNLFCEWVTTSGFEYKTNKVSFGRNVSNGGYGEMITDKRTKTSRFKSFDVPALKKYWGFLDECFLKK